jgi:hypothetical protein
MDYVPRANKRISSTCAFSQFSRTRKTQKINQPIDFFCLYNIHFLPPNSQEKIRIAPASSTLLASLQRFVTRPQPVDRGGAISLRRDSHFSFQSMEPMKRKRPNFAAKVALVSGDCALPNLGLSPEDQQRLSAEVNCILHCAATVRFDEKLREATHINVRAVMDLLRMAKQMKNLKVRRQQRNVLKHQ